MAHEAGDDAPDAHAKEEKGPIDWFLSLFADVKAGEGLTAVVLMLDVFLLLVAYYLLKTVREPLILEGGGVELKNYASACQALTLTAFIPCYAWLTKRLARMTLVTATLVFFAANLCLFWLLATLKVPYVGFAFFVWLGCFSLTAIAQFWSLANDLYTPEQGKRLFAIVGIGSSVGAVAGSYVAAKFTAKQNPAVADSPPNVSPYLTMVISAGLLMLCLALAWYANTREAERKARAQKQKDSAPEEKPIGGKNGFSLILEDRYLLFIALLILLLNLVNSTGETILDLTILEEAKRQTPDFDSLSKAAQGNAIKTFVGPFRGNFFFWVNLVGAFTQLFLVSRIFKYLGLRAALFSLPIIGLVVYGGISAFPVLALVRLGKIAENATDYSLYNTTKQALWLPTSREQKYNAKMTIDSFVVRSGDLVASGASIAFLAMGFGVRTYAILNVAFIALWMVLVVVIGRENAKRTDASA
ncbi:MAG: MFS transporter [Labilithrix sp.]|nr:MFS transporter [Labilithrix sp.]